MLKWTTAMFCKLGWTEDLTMTIDELTKAIDTLKSEISEMQVQLKRAGEDRGSVTSKRAFQGDLSQGTICLTLLV